MLFDNGYKVVANLWVKPAVVLKHLGIPTRLQQEDWQVLHDYGFATLAYDYEEGLKFQATQPNVRHVKKLVEALTSWVKAKDIPLTNADGRPVITFDMMGLLSNNNTKKFEDLMKKVGCVCRKSKYGNWNEWTMPEPKKKKKVPAVETAPVKAKIKKPKIMVKIGK